MNIKICRQCNIVYSRNKQYSDKQWRESKNCSRVCAVNSRRTGFPKFCAGCNDIFTVPLHRKTTAKYCSRACYGGPTHSDGQGYLRVRGSQKRVHRSVAEEYLGRGLEADEVVHHINQNKSDNRIENLIVLTRAWHLRIHKLLAINAENIRLDNI